MKSIALALFAALTLSAGSVSAAQLILSDGQTHIINYSVGENLAVSNSTHVVLENGASIGQWRIQLEDTSTVEVRAGAFTGSDLVLTGSSHADIKGGIIPHLLVDDNSSADVQGGTHGMITGMGSGSISIYGGNIYQHAIANYSSTLDIFGGAFEPNTVVRADLPWSKIKIYGTDFKLDGAPVPFGTCQCGYGFGTQRLEGILTSGDVLSVKVMQDNYTFEGEIELVQAEPIPQPSTALLLGIGLIGMSLRRRAKIFWTTD